MKGHPLYSTRHNTVHNVYSYSFIRPFPISSVIVGAPKEDTSKFQQDVHRGGAVFKCDIRENNQCIMIPFDRNRKFTFHMPNLG